MWLAVDENGSEHVFAGRPYREYSSQLGGYWTFLLLWKFIKLRRGSIKKLIGRELSWEDEPVELKDE